MYDYYDEDGVSNESPPVFPIVCCEANDCCDEGEIWPEWMSKNKPFCCIPDEVLENPNGSFECCCENEDHTCCPNLDLHCQPEENEYCCDIDEHVCHGEC